MMFSFIVTVLSGLVFGVAGVEKLAGDPEGNVQHEYVGSVQVEAWEQLDEADTGVCLARCNHGAVNDFALYDRNVGLRQVLRAVVKDGMFKVIGAFSPTLRKRELWNKEVASGRFLLDFNKEVDLKMKLEDASVCLDVSPDPVNPGQYVGLFRYADRVIQVSEDGRCVPCETDEFGALDCALSSCFGSVKSSEHSTQGKKCNVGQKVRDGKALLDSGKGKSDMEVKLKAGLAQAGKELGSQVSPKENCLSKKTEHEGVIANASKNGATEGLALDSASEKRLPTTNTGSDGSLFERKDDSVSPQKPQVLAESLPSSVISVSEEKVSKDREECDANGCLYVQNARGGLLERGEKSKVTEFHGCGILNARQSLHAELGDKESNEKFSSCYSQQGFSGSISKLHSLVPSIPCGSFNDVSESSLPRRFQRQIETEEKYLAEPLHIVHNDGKKYILVASKICLQRRKPAICGNLSDTTELGVPSNQDTDTPSKGAFMLKEPTRIVFGRWCYAMACLPKEVIVPDRFECFMY